MPAIAAVAPYLAIGATAVGAFGQYQAGRDAKRQAELAAAQDERDAIASQARAQREMLAERRKASYTRSRALAVAGASGAGVGDKTVSDILTGIDTEGDMNALTALYNGDFTAQNLNKRAALTRRAGSDARDAANLGAITTLFTGGLDFAANNPTFFQKYGGQKAQQAMGIGTGMSDMSRNPPEDWVA